MFRDRTDAGEQLAALLKAYRGLGALVLGLPRGGVPVAAVVARKLDADIDVLIAQKVGAPGQKEFAIGAVSEHGTEVKDEKSILSLGLREEEWERAKGKAVASMMNHIGLFRSGRDLPDLSGRTVIIVDDGLATGRTAQAAVRAISALGPNKIAFAAPVASVRGKQLIEKEKVDKVVAVFVPLEFQAVGQFYRDFSPVESDEVLDVLGQFHRAGD